MIKTKADEIAVANGAYFDPAQAERVREFFRRFVRVRVKGGTQPLVMNEWQDEVNTALFGWRRKSGLRRFSEAWVSTGKKNGKSFWAAALLIYMLVVEAGPGVELFSFATEREQASLIYREAAKIIRASPQLKKIITPIRTTKTLMFDDHGSFFRSCSSESSSADGINATMCLIDEVHRMRSRELIDTLKYSGTAIEAKTGQPPLMIYTTTAGYDRSSIAYEIYSYAKRVRDGELHDDAFYVYIREANMTDNPALESTWKKANPALGTDIMSLADFRRDYDEAQNNPAAMSRFLRLRLNCWTEQSTRLIPLDVFDACGDEIPDHTGDECCGGLDLSSVVGGDTTSFQLVFQNDLGGYDILTHVFIPEDGLEAQGRKNGVSYSAWARAGMLITTPGIAINYETIYQKIKELSVKYKIREIAYDAWNSAKIIPRLEEDGFICVPIRQGFSLSQPAKEFMRLLITKQIRHANHPVFKNHCGNVEARYDQHENIKLEKPGGSASKLRIDSVVASVMAIDRMMRLPKEEVEEELSMGFF